MEVGNKIRYQRELRELSRKQLSEMSGVAEISITQYELGKRQPKLKQLIKIAKALDVDPFILITEDNYPDECYQKWLEASEPIYKYLDSLGYKIELEQEEFKLGGLVGKKGTGNVMLASSSVGSVKYSKKEFEEFKQKIKESVDYLVWQKNKKEPPSAITENGSDKSNNENTIK